MAIQPRVRRILLTILGPLLLTGLGYGAFLAVRAAFRVFASLDSGLAVGIIAGAATVLISVLTVLLGKFFESRALIRKEHREKKIPVYEDLIKFMFRVLMGTKTGDTPSERELLVFMMDFTQRIMVWGSDDVLTAWVRWRRFATNEADLKASPMKLMLLYEELIFAIRLDLGHKNKGLSTGDMLALFVNDIDELIAAKGS